MIIERTRNSIRNTAWGFIQKFVSLAGPFIVRTVLIYKLSAEYSGLNSLFSSILQILSLSELGFSNAIVFSMYKPIAEDDADTICALLRLYRKAYKIVGLFILGAGAAVLPFIKVFIKGGVPADINVYILYAIFLVNTALSYLLFAYKTSLLSAHQREDVISRNTTISNSLMYIAQVLVLLLFSNFYYYVILLPTFTVLINILNSRAVDRMYPTLKCRGIVSPEIKKDLKKRLVGVIIWKIGGTTRNTLDSIVISSFIGLTMVTIYNNYYLIMNGVIGILGITTASMQAGVGNKIASESVDVNYRDFYKFHFLYMWISSFALICMLCLYQPFMKLWMGADLMLPTLPMVLFCVYFYILKTGDINSTYYTAAGLWWYGKYRSLIEACINLVLNISLGYYFGVVGILLATIIGMLSIWWYSSGIVFRRYFKKYTMKEYALRSLQYVLITAFVAAVTYWFCGFVPFRDTKGDLVLTCILRLLICCCSNILFWLIYRKTRWYPDAKEFVLSLLRRISRR